MPIQIYRIIIIYKFKLFNFFDKIYFVNGDGELSVKLSVVLPACIGVNEFEKVLNNLDLQNIKDIEIVYIADSSDRKSLDIAKKFVQKYECFRVISTEKLSFEESKNLALDNAQGEYIYFVKSGDYLKKHALKGFLSCAQKTEADVIVADCKVYNSLSEKIAAKSVGTLFSHFQYKTFSGFDFSEDFFQKFDFDLNNKLFKTSFIKENQIKFSETKYFNELLFVYGALYCAQKIVCCNCNIFKFLNKSFTSEQAINYVDYVKDCLKNYNELYRFIKKQQASAELKDSLIKRIVSSVGACFEHVSGVEFFKAVDEIRACSILFDEELVSNKEFSKNYFNGGKISFVVPVYNVERYLQQCLDSLVNQTYKNIEIICVNDGSSDNSGQILQKFAEIDSRVKIINTENLGVSIARNKGIEAASGDYIAFIDSDDWCEPDYLEKMYKNIISFNTDFSTCAVALYDEAQNVFFDEVYYSLQDLRSYMQRPLNFDDVKNILFRFPVMVWAKLIRTQLLKENNIRFCDKVYFEDKAFFFDLVLNSQNFSFVLEELYVYRVNREGSAVYSRSEKYLDFIKHYSYIKSLLHKTMKYAIVKDLFWEHVWSDFYIRFQQINLSLKPTFYNNFIEFLNENYEKGMNKDIDKFLMQQSYEKLLARSENKKSFIQNIFSLKNSGDYKILTILGLQIKKHRYKKL